MALARRRPRWSLALLAFSLVPLAYLGVAPPAIAGTSVFTQDGDMVMGTAVSVSKPDGLVIPGSGTAAPYPSTLSVSGVPGVVIDVSLVLMSLDHAVPDDLDVMLVGPNGQGVVVMSDVGGAHAVTDLDLHLDDDMSDPLPDDGQLFSFSSYHPGNVAEAAADTFPAPAPAPSGSSALSQFDGIDPNGVWQLYVVDDTGGSAGNISGGWTLDIRTGTNPYPSTLAVSGVNGHVVDVNVTLIGLTHRIPADINALLVGPHGEQVTLMSDAGGYAADGRFAVANLDLTLDDEAFAKLPDQALIAASSYRPADYPPVGEDYPAPAPDATGKTDLGAAFDGIDPNGTWQLFVYDDQLDNDEAGTLSGWRLEIRWADTVPPAGAVSVEGGAATSDSKAVTLNVSASDPAPGEGVTRMRFSNDGTTFSLFQPYAATAAWTLVAGDGPRTVYAQFSDGAGNLSPVVSDTITLAVGPKATKVRPAKHAKQVKTDAKVKVFANEALAAKTVTKQHITLKKKGNPDKVKAVVTYKPGKQLIQLKPKQPLAHDTTYKVTVTSKVTDLAGNGWDQKAKAGTQPLKWTFTTR